MNSQRSPLFFYQFLGVHSLLIGLLPFFLPVYLWKHGIGVPGLCLLIGVSGLSFVAALRPWQHIWYRWKPQKLISLTFAFELFLVASVGWFSTIPGAALFDIAANYQLPSKDVLLPVFIIGIANGVYNAFFWTTQRTLFIQQLGNNDSGKQYGNFQIFVTVFLKIGILLGGLLLDFGGFLWLLALSAGTGFAATTYLSKKAYSALTDQRSRITLQQSLRYKDIHGSQRIFAIDGLFLYLESHFWTLSLFLIVRQDYSRLGIAVVILAVVFAVLFYIIKNRIDQLAVEKVYKAAVWLYAASWLLRFTLDDNSEGAGYLIALVLITFCSSFFRLAFNKRFFDVARKSSAVDYLLMKSYSSQTYLGLLYLILGASLVFVPFEHLQTLQYAYAGAAVLSLAYLNYRED
ncbi:MAG: hypothetical protein ACI8VW_000397 [bacterium]